MCGFVGFLNDTSDIELNKQSVRQMADKITHRGPDDDNYYVDEGVSIGFRRLSIIDLQGGAQPIFNEDGTMVLVFNGEIYNYQTIRTELIERGHIFKTKSDSEVLLTAMRSTALSCSISFVACLPLLYGISRQTPCSAQGISSASSPFLLQNGIPSFSHRKSRPSCPPHSKGV